MASESSEIKNDETYDESSIENRKLMEYERKINLSVLSLIGMVDQKAQYLIRDRDNENSEKKRERLKKLINGCNKMKKVFSNDDEMEDYRLKSIKLIFNRMTNSSKLILEKNKKAFDQRDKEDKINPLIPGIDIGIIYKYFEESETNELWELMHSIYANSVRLITSIKPSMNKNGILDDVEEIEKQIDRSSEELAQQTYDIFHGIKGEHDNSVFSMNDFVNNSENYDKDDIYHTISKLMTKQTDVGKLLQGLEISEDSIKESLNKVFGLLTGSDDDNETKNIAIEHITNLTKELREEANNGKLDGVDTKSFTQRVMEKSKNYIEKDPEKFRQVSEFIQSNMENGPLGSSGLTNKFQQMMEGNDKMDPEKLKKMVGELAGAGASSGETGESESGDLREKLRSNINKKRNLRKRR